ncbi:MAG TPA: zinc ribbon domain-containing protein [Sedimentisphaerales bacterium]|nr:zinc ribbon domain-containing protein [Sedimentisphaerales bacterium]
MPIYEYKCGKCGRINEFLENFSSRSSRTCVYCGSKKLEKQFSVFAPGVKVGDSKRCHGCSDNTCPGAGH